MDKLMQFVKVWVAAGRTEDDARAAYKAALEKGVATILPGDRDLFVRGLAAGDGDADVLTFHVPITKVDEERREVWGFSTTEMVDTQDDRIRIEAAEKAYQDHAAKFGKRTGGKSLGTVREMHKDWTAGKLIAWKRDTADTAQGPVEGIMVGCKIVDDAAWKKCREGVYSMFSISGRITDADVIVENGKLIRDVKAFKLNETSLVDDGANAGAVFTMVKIDGGATFASVPEITAAEKIDAQVFGYEAAVDTIRKIQKTRMGAAAEPAAPMPAPPAPAAPPAAPAETGPAPRPGVRALRFKRASFTAAQALEWARAHRFAYPAPKEEGDFLLVGQAPDVRFKAASADDPKPIELAPGVTAILGVRASATRPRVRELLGAVRKALPSSELSSIFSGLDAIAAIARGIDTEVWEAYAKGLPALPDEEKAGVLQLSEAANTLLEWLAGEFAEQARALAAPGGGAAIEALAKVQELSAIRRVLDPIQLRKVGEDEGQADNLTKMHEIGHALCDATMAMGGACKAGLCKAAGEEEPVPGEAEGEGEAAPAAEGGEGGAPVPGAEDEEAKAKKIAGGARPAKGGAAAGDSTNPGFEKILGAVAKVGDAVAGVAGRVASLEQRVEGMSKAPAYVGRTVRSVEKTIGGPDGQVVGSDLMIESLALEKAAQDEPNPEASARLRKRAAALSIRAGATPQG